MFFLIESSAKKKIVKSVAKIRLESVFIVMFVHLTMIFALLFSVVWHCSEGNQAAIGNLWRRTEFRLSYMMNYEVLQQLQFFTTIKGIF